MTNFIKKFEDFKSNKTSELKEQKLPNSKLLQTIIDGETTKLEGVTISPEMATQLLNMYNSGFVDKRMFDSAKGGDLKKMLDTFKSLAGIKENNLINEGEIASEEDFKEYAMKVLKKMHGEDFDEDKATETIDDIISKCDGDWGTAIGMLNKG